MAQFKITEARLRVIKERQWEDRWGSNYVAAIWADPKEAPGISTGSILRPRKVGQREFHTLSAAETFTSLLALYHPGCWEAWEQRIMFPGPRAHPLFGHPLASGIPFKPFAGTIDVAARLGMLTKHPKVRMRIGDDPAKWPVVPFPYIGDLLIFMRDNEGLYVLNLSIKHKFIDFRRKGPSGRSRVRSDVDDPGAILRHRLEVIYFDDAGIRTQQIAREGIPDDLCWNLRDLFLDDTYVTTVSDSQRAEIMERIRAEIGQDNPAYVQARQLAREHKIEEREVVALIKQGIWRRELRVDLFRPILMDRPLRPEVTDVCEHFSTWFAR